MNLPMAQIPNFQLPGPAPIQQQPGLIQGIAGGIGKGLDAAAQFQQIALQRQQQQLMQAKMIQEQQQAEMTEKLKKFQQVNELYKNTHKKLRPAMWETVATQANSLLGTHLDPNIMPESANDAIDAAHQEINNLIEGKQSFGDTMKKLGMLSVSLDEDTRKAVEASRGFLMDTEEGQKIKNLGTQGSYAFAGFDPSTKQPIFSYSRAPMLITSDGKQFTGTPQSKEDLDKTTEEIRKVKGIQQGILEIEKIMSKIPSGAKGGAESAATSIPGGNLAFPEVAQYNDSIPAMAVAFYRAATGDTRLSDADAKARALPLFPRAGDAEKIKTSKIELMKRMLQNRHEALMSGVNEIPFKTESSGSPGSTNPHEKQKISATAQSLIDKWENK